MLCRPEREDTFLGAGFLLVAPRAAESRIETVLVQRLPQPLRLHHVGVDRRAMRERVDVHRQTFGIDVHDQLHTHFGGAAIAERVHVAEFPRRVDVEQRKRRPGGEERLDREVQHHGAVLADRIEHHRIVGLGDDFPDDVDAFRFEPLQIGECHPGRVFDARAPEREDPTPNSERLDI